MRVPKGVETPLGSDFDVEAILKQLTLDEKVSLLAGKDLWHTIPVPRLGIPSIRRSDGPNGIRGTRFFGSVPSACLSCGMAIGATFNQELAREIGHLLADKARAKGGAHLVLGPTVNIPRAPLGGRGFESYSQDPRPGPSFLGSGTMEETASVELVEGRMYEILVQWGCAKTSKLKAPGTVDFGHGGFRISGCRRLDPAENSGLVMESAAVQTYIAPITKLSPTVPRRPPQEPKAFLKVAHLRPGEARKVQFAINPTKDMSY